MKSLIAPFLFFVCVFACTKDRAPLPTIPAPTYDTVFPGDYLPLYPGSWWEYISSTGEIIKHTVDDKYQLNSYDFDSAGKTYSSTPRYVPIFNYNGPMPFYRYSSPMTFNYSGEKLLLPFLSEKVGEIWKCGIDNKAIYYSKVINKDTIINVGGRKYVDVITTYLAANGNFNRPIYIDFFARNIGIIKMETVDYNVSPPDTYITKRLVNYHINH